MIFSRNQQGKKKRNNDMGSARFGVSCLALFCFRGRYQSQELKQNKPQHGPKSIERHWDQKHRVNLKKRKKINLSSKWGGKD